MDSLSHSGGFSKCLEIFLIVKTGKVLLASGGSRSRGLYTINTMQRTDFMTKNFLAQNVNTAKIEKS